MAVLIRKHHGERRTTEKQILTNAGAYPGSIGNLCSIRVEGNEADTYRVELTPAESRQIGGRLLRWSTADKFESGEGI